MAVALSALATCCSPRSEAWVRVNDERVTLPAASSTVADVLESAGGGPRPGMVISIVTGRPLRPNGNPPVLQVDGKPASLQTLLRTRSRLVTADGIDTIEEVQSRDRLGPPPQGAPAVERTLWQPGKPRRERAWVGSISGEVVATLVTEPEVPPQAVHGKVVALTFDDGPDRRYTPAILDILKEEGVRATFCIIGRHGRDDPALVRAETDAGHAHCNHTVNHRVLPGKGSDYVYGEVAGGSEFLTAIDGSSPQLFRAPSGQVSPEVIDMVHSRGMRVLGWSVESNDYLKLPSDVIVRHVLAAVHPGAVILLHDGGGDRSGTVAALRPIIQGLKSQGYRFATPVDPAA